MSIRRTAEQDMTKPRRHKWGERIVVSPYKTERECEHGCGIVRVTRHEANSHWVEFWRGLEKLPGDVTPVCEAVEP